MSQRRQPHAATSQVRLNAYIGQVQRRLRWNTAVRGAAILAAAALLITVALVVLLDAHAFPLRAVVWSRAVLAVSLALTIALVLAVPLLRLTRARSVRRAEKSFPAFGDRLQTFAQRQTQPAPFLELLAADTLAVAESSPPSHLGPPWRLPAFTAAIALFTGTLAWLILTQPGYIGYGAALLWTGQKAPPLYAIQVAPGDAALRRDTGELITANLINIQTGPGKSPVQLFARYANSPRWEPVEMQPQPGAAGFQFLFASLPQDVEYYVKAGPVTTSHFKLRVLDMPAVTRIQVTYKYPAWTGLKPTTEENGGDLRALEGTTADLEIHTDKPLPNGLLIRDDGTPLKLTGGENNAYHASLTLQKDGAYHFAGLDSGQPVRLSEDYFIATNKAEPPQVAIEKPANDYHASPIEEVTIRIKGSADYGLHALALHYSVNGAPEQTVSLLKSPGLRQADGSQTLSLESFKLDPGDVVSLYATAKDGHAESKTGISFIQADPFEREYSQSQSTAGGGGGGGQQSGNDQGEISRRQKELIAATWKQQNTKDASAKASDDAGKFLSDVQSKLRQQVTALSSRLESRDLTGGNETFSAFEKDMQQAADAMTPATTRLQQMQWHDALTSEQKALQALLRAEATFRQIQVAFGNRSSQGGGGGGSMGRDLASLLDLELDTQKNQYESAQTASPQEQQQKKVDEALEKLDALAKRQDELAQQEQKDPKQTFQQRWQQEMLRREAEQLRRQMEQMAQNQSQPGQSGQPQSGSQRGTQSGQPTSSSSAQSGSQSASGQPSGSSSGQFSASRRASAESSAQPPQTAADPRVQQALSRLRTADDQMRRAASPQSGRTGAQQAANDAARRAADELKQATNLLGGAQQSQASGKLSSLSQEAGRLAAEERAQAERIRQFASQTSSNAQSPQPSSRDQVAQRLAERNRLADDRQALSDGLSRLERQLRDAQREFAPLQPGVSTKLRDALGGMDQDELGNRVQRTADWLRRGIDPDSNGTEDTIRAGLDKLSQQVRQAGQSVGSAPNPQSQPRGGGGDQVAALDALDRFRSRVESLTNPTSAQPGSGPTKGRPGQSNSGGIGQPNANRGQFSSSPQPGSSPSNRSGGQNAGQSSREASGQSADLGNRINRAGGNTDASVWGNLNTGNNRFDHTRNSADPTPQPNPTDTERTFSQAARELNQLRQAAAADPAAEKEIQQLARRMQQLDPARFPGNPALVEQLNTQVLSQVDKLELELRQAVDRDRQQIRGARSRPPAPAYQDAVADYYKRLSATHP
jgi:hypothetical protein